MKWINPYVPDEYNYTTYYQEIPRECLNPRISNVRGIVKWAPFATIPEQHEMLNKYKDNQNKIEKPILSDDQLND